MSLVKDKAKSREDGPGVVKEEEEEEAKEERDLLGETEVVHRGFCRLDMEI